MNCKIYASDEGYGHLIRQSAIVEELRELNPGINVTLQTKLLLSAAKRILNGVGFVEKFNNITWAKQKDGSPDLDKIKAFYTDYTVRANNFVFAENDINQFDFIISDFVYEAFPLAARSNIPAFGVGHVTWDWFFSKLYPIPVDSSTLERMRDFAMSADVLYFPPFTPQDILNVYRRKVKEVPLIVRRRRENLFAEQKNGKFNVLMMDSGGRVLTRSIEAAIAQAGDIDDCQFFVSSIFRCRAGNVTLIPENELFSDYIPHMDLVIARGGFNTISECVASRTPLLIMGESLNPEMELNMLNIKQEGLGSFISLENIQTRFKEFLHRFLDHEYELILKNMNNHEYQADGAKVIAEDILNRLEITN